METNLSEKHIAPVKRRIWSKIEKQNILLEAETAGVSPTARAYKINASQIFTWRKELFGSRRIDNNTVHAQTQAGEIRSSLARINALLDAVSSASKQLLCESKAQKQPILNLSAAINNLASATAKLESQKLALMEQLAKVIILEKQPMEITDKEFEAEVEREAEKVLLHLVKTRILPRQAQERHQQATAS